VATQSPDRNAPGKRSQQEFPVPRPQTAPAGSPVARSVERRFECATRAFLDEYLLSETGRVPFGGRDRELRRLDAWLQNEQAAPRMLITAPAGRGKSALLVQWIESLKQRGLVAANNWQLVFVPISIRVGTNRPSEFLAGLALRLAEIIGEALPQGAVHDTFTLGHTVRDQLESIASSDRRMLVVIDGLDEAMEGTFVPAFSRRACRQRSAFSCRRAGRSGTLIRTDG
jgi:hypothetical protein